MNTNTSSGFQGLVPQVVTVSTATPLVWTNNSTPALVNGALLVLQADPDLPTGGSFDAQPFRVRIAGKVNVAATGVVTVGLYLGNSSTLASDTLLASAVSGSVTAPAGTNFFLEADMIWDSTSGRVSGMSWGTVGTGGTPSNGVLSNSPSAITTSASLQFVAAVTFGAANAANSITVTEFSVETV